LFVKHLDRSLKSLAAESDAVINWAGLVVRRITVLVAAGAAGVVLGSILPLPGRTKVATSLENDARTSAAVTLAAKASAIPACASNADGLGAASRQDQDWVSSSSKLTTSSWAHWDHAAQLLLKAAQTRKKSDIEAASAQMERVLRRDNCL
jgi:hypothetical protein